MFKNDWFVHCIYNRAAHKGGHGYVDTKKNTGSYWREYTVKTVLRKSTWLGPTYTRHSKNLLRGFISLTSSASDRQVRPQQHLSLSSIPY